MTSGTTLLLWQMETHAFGFRLRANAPEGQKRFPISISGTKRRDMIRSLLEGVTFGMLDALDIIRPMNIPISQIRASGGGARSQFSRQLQADIYNAPIVTTNAAEGPAYGAAFLAGVGTSPFENVEEACKISIRRIDRIMPNRALAKAYDRSHAVYRKLHFDLKPRFSEISEFRC